MVFSPKGYCGDEVMSKYLTKAGSYLDIHGLYGFFYGCLAASKEGMPSGCLPMILSREDAASETEEESQAMITGIMKLWNILSRWNPECEPLVFPDMDYIVSKNGLRERVEDDISLINYFIEGLDLGGADESDLSDEGLDALRYLSEADFFLDKYTELTGHDDVGGDAIEKTFDLIDQMEEIVVECIARITIDLKEAIPGARKDPGIFSDDKTERFRGARIWGHDICPCGSGRKYRKCCGLTH